MDPLIAQVDHLVYATPDVARSVESLASQLGIRAAAGGKHPLWGTHNALIALGGRCYLEIVGPDPEAEAPASGPRPFGLDALRASRLVTWAAHGTDLGALTRRARAAGVDPGAAVERSRMQPDGILLRWTMTDSLAERAGGVIPFFIDWGDAPHPAASAPPGPTLTGLRARHPDAARVTTQLRVLGVALEVEPGPAPELIATLATLNGTVELR